MGFVSAVTVHPSVILWLSVLYYLKPEIVLPFLMACLLHELGHYSVLCLLKKPPVHISLSFTGAVMDIPGLSYREELMAAAAGPLVSLILSLLTPVLPAVGLYSFFLGLTNLIPIAGLDGGRMLRCFLRLHSSVDSSEKAEKTVGIAAGGLLLLFGLMLSVHGNLGLWPLLLAAAILLRAAKT